MGSGVARLLSIAMVVGYVVVFREALLRVRTT